MPASNPRRILPYLLLFVSAASWGGNWVAARAVSHEVMPFALVFWRWLLAGVFLYPFAARRLRGDLSAAFANRGWLLFFGIIGLFGFAALSYFGLRHTTAVNAALLNASLPIYMVPLAWLVRRDTIGVRQLGGLVFSLAGAAVIITRGELATLTGFRPNPGDLLILAAVGLWALYTVFLHRKPRMHPLSFLFFTIAIAAVFSAPFYALEAWTAGGFAVNTRTAASIGYLALFPSLVAYVCWNYSVIAVGPNVASFFHPLVPVFGTLFAILLLGEQVHAHHLAGFALVLAGITLTSAR